MNPPFALRKSFGVVATAVAVFSIVNLGGFALTIWALRLCDAYPFAYPFAHETSSWCCDRSAQRWHAVPVACVAMWCYIGGLVFVEHFHNFHHQQEVHEDQGATEKMLWHFVSALTTWLLVGHVLSLASTGMIILCQSGDTMVSQCKKAGHSSQAPSEHEAGDASDGQSSEFSSARSVASAIELEEAAQNVVAERLAQTGIVDSTPSIPVFEEEGEGDDDDEQSLFTYDDVAVGVRVDTEISSVVDASNLYFEEEQNFQRASFCAGYFTATRDVIEMSRNPELRGLSIRRMQQMRRITANMTIASQGAEAVEWDERNERNERQPTLAV